MEPIAAPRRLALLLATSLIVVLALVMTAAPRSVEAAGALLSFPQASCGASSANVSFSWAPPAGATETWLDVSTNDNGFVAGSFMNAGPLSGGASSYTWGGLKTHTPYFWRVDSRLASGWVASETGVFVACSEPILLASNPDCLSATDASVSFSWAPTTPATRQQWIDVSSQGSFTAGGYTGHGPFNGGTFSYKLDHLAPGGYAYRIQAEQADGTWRSSIARTFVANCGANVDIDLHDTGDTLVYKRLNITAPVNVRQVGPDGAMLNPEGKDDVVRYDFSAFSGLGGYPGNGGTTVLAGHLDYRPYYQAVFYPLSKAARGDVIEYYRGDGVVKTYVVDWVSSIPFDQSLNEYIVSTNPETMVLITCDGTFDSTGGGYNKRAIVYAIAANY